MTDSLSLPSTPGAVAAEVFDAYQSRVLGVLRDLAQEVGGARALRAVAPKASLERDIGLGSLERVELLLRLESAFGRSLGDRFLLIDTPAELARALLERVGDEPAAVHERGLALPRPTSVTAEAATIHEAFKLRALAEPDRPHVYLRDEDGREQEITYGQLWDAASAIAGGLLERGMRKGDTVALMLPTGAEFLHSFLGILLTGAIPVPIYPPIRLDRLEEYAARQGAILANAGARCLITIPRARPIVRMLQGVAPSLTLVTAADDLSQIGARVRAGTSTPEDPALIQYTSGSTAEPKGVLLTHANLVANIRAIAAGLDLQPTDVGASWLPLYHDMGLIGSWLSCVYHGNPLALQSPTSFLARPERWLWAIHQHRATISAAPNFAYELCIRKVSDQAIEGLDLSSWRCALNGAEPVSPDTLDRFARRFERYGFQREAFLPVYGLAECSVALAFPPLGRGPLVDRVKRHPFEHEARAEPVASGDSSALRFVSVGRPLPLHEVRIVDDAGAELPERAVGRLVFRGPSMTPGYFRNPEATAAITLPDGWLDTGDLAYQHAGELYITGRQKDLIIKGGRNLVPQEIEAVTAEVDGIRKGSVVAFGVPNAALGTEMLVIVAETRLAEPEAKARLESATIARVAEMLGVPPDRIVLVEPGSIPKTSSGKIRRGATRELYLSGALGGSRSRATLRQRVALVAGMARGVAQAKGRPALARVGRALYIAYLTLAFAAIVPASWIVSLMLPSRHAAHTIARRGARLCLRIVGCRLSVEGLEHLPTRGAFLLASNHASYADVAALLALLPPGYLFVAKREMLRWPILGRFVRTGGHLTVERWDVQQSVADIQTITRALGQGERVLIFPEGTFSATTGLRPFRLGGFVAAVETGRPIVPLALRGTRQVLRATNLFPRPGAIHMWIGEPIAPDGQGWAAAVALRDRVADAIAQHCGEPRLDVLDAGPVGG